MTQISAKSSMKIPLMRPTFDHEEEQAIVGVLRSGWVTQGPVVAEFEQLVADYVGAKHGIAVTSCTTALSISLEALGVGPGDEVICPSHTYIATPNSVIHVGATPVFADIDERTHCIDPASIEAAITPRTKAIMPVHITMACDIDAIYDIATRHNLLVIEDAAPAIGAEYKGRKVGSSDGPVSFSFHPRKIITTGEGGMVMTNDDALAAKLRLLRHHFMSVSDTARHGATELIFDEYEEVGYNLRMTDLQASVGVVQMGKLQRILDERRSLASAYNERLASHPFITTPYVPDECTSTYQSYIVQLLKDAPISRDDFMREMLARGITTKRGIMNAHKEKAYTKRFGEVSLPVTERIWETSLVLPLFSGMTTREQEYVLNSVADILERR